MDAYSRGSSLDIKSIIGTADQKLNLKNATRFEVEQPKDVLLEGKGILCEPDKCFDKTSFTMSELYNNPRADHSAVTRRYKALIEFIRKVCPGQS